MKNHTKRNQAFTLIELLTVIAIIAVLAGLLFPAFQSAMRKGETAQAQTDIKMIESAIQAYHLQYGLYPVVPLSNNDNGGDYCFGGLGGYANNGQLMDILRSFDRGPGNSGFANNLRKIVFINASQKSLDSTGNYLDPWGRQYEITIDTGNDNICNGLKGGYADVPNRTVVVWSCGPDGKPNTTDDIRSWK
jgi:prepilin-type N-terminal cleavage/methylation domain-containing protein